GGLEVLHWQHDLDHRAVRPVLLLLGMRGVRLATHQVELNRSAHPGAGGRRGGDRRAVEIDQVSVARDPAPDEQLAAIPGAPELAADVPARETATLLPDAAEQGRSRGPEDPDVRERHEGIGVVHEHGTILLPESAPSTRG